MPESPSAWQLVIGGDAGLYAIVFLSLLVSVAAVALASLVGLPLGAFLALVDFPGRTTLVVILKDRKSTRLNSSHIQKSRMPSSA